MKNKYVIIGAAAAGLGAINKLRMLDPEAEIVCITDEKENPYNKCLLADYMTEQPNGSKIIMMTPEQAGQKNIELRLGQRVIEIMPDNKSVMLNSSEQIFYDKLLLAMGSSPRKIAIKGGDNLKGMFTFHTLNDIHTIKNYITDHSVTNAVVIGAGLSGLECADALNQLGVSVAIIEKNEHILSTQLGVEAARVIEKAISQHHILLYKQIVVSEIVGNNSYVSKVILSNGVELSSQMVIVAAGLAPNIFLAEKVGIATCYGVLVDEYLQTNLPDIYAAGDLIMIRDHLTGNLTPNCTWPDAMMQGMTAACNMAGQSKKYVPAAIMTSSAFFGLKFAACGKPNVENQQQWQVKSDENSCSAFLLSSQGNLLGFNVVGAKADFGALRRLVLTKQPVTLEYLYSL